MTPKMRRIDIRVLLFMAKSFLRQHICSRFVITYSNNHAIRAYQEETRKFNRLLLAEGRKIGPMVHTAILGGKCFTTLWQVFSHLPLS
jgi:hypothetical protein